MIATRKISAPDRALKQHVADDGEAYVFFHVHHMARRVAGAVAYPEGHVAEVYFVSVHQPARGLEGAGA